jgi:hypothetical protein
VVGQEPTEGRDAAEGSERGEVWFGSTRIAYQVVRGRRRHRTIAIAIEPARGVVVRAPVATPRSRIEELVRRRAAWIVERQRRLAALPHGHGPRELVSGETFLYLGRQYRLAVARADVGEVDLETVRLRGRCLVAPHPRGPHDPAHVRRALVAWYRAHAERRIPERVAAWAERLGLEPKAVLVRDQRKRWGSADAKGVLRLNWRLVQAPVGLIDYVAVHELVHLRHHGHGRAFWSAVGEAMPDYEERRTALRALGGRLVW